MGVTSGENDVLRSKSGLELGHCDLWFDLRRKVKTNVFRRTFAIPFHVGLSNLVDRYTTVFCTPSLDHDQCDIQFDHFTSIKEMFPDHFSYALGISCNIITLGGCVYRRPYVAYQY